MEFVIKLNYLMLLFVIMLFIIFVMYILKDFIKDV